jgi:hypothetical protein
MPHCPHCGKATPFEGAVVCPFCGTRLDGTGAPARAGQAAAGKTIVGVAVEALAPRLPAIDASGPAGAVGSKANRTIVGMPASEARAGKAAGSSPGGEAAPTAGSAVNRTMVGLANTRPLGTPASPPSVSRPDPAGGTLLGVARPGIAPLNPGQAPEGDEDLDDGPTQLQPEAPPHGYEPAGELGATLGPAALGGAFAMPQASPQQWDPARRRHRVRVGPQVAGLPKARSKTDATSKRVLAVVFAAGGLALVAVLVAVFWPSPPPLTARARADAEGREGVELRCPGCPDGTKVSIGEASATMASGTALVALPAALSLGENRMKVAIDRPGSGRDETVGVVVNVAYRIRPDLSTLQADHPSIQIVAEAARGTTIAVNGRTLPLAEGRAVETIDVTDACTGLSGDPKTLSRQVPYAVTPADGPAEQGVVNVSVGIVPLQIEAPGPHVTIDGGSFVLAGKTMKGAEVLAAGRPISVRADGTFAQVMNVSSPGATQIEVRARVTGLAPRLSQIKVRRVDNLDTAAREFMAEAPINWGPLASNLAGQIGKATVLSGEVSDTRKQGYQTVMLLDVSTASGCPSAGACSVRLVQGSESSAKKGDTLKVYGHVARVYAVQGRPDIAEIEVDFTTGGTRPAKGAK